MKAKSNPFLFRALVPAALFALAPLHAADVSTTGGATLNSNNPGNKYIDAGTLTVSGGTVELGTSDAAPLTEFAMSGGLINIVSGTTLRNGGWATGIWTNNKATLQVDGTLEVWDGPNNIFADALTGSGAVTIGNVTWISAVKSISVGVNGGGGTFTGALSDASGDNNDRLNFIKASAGTQVLTGTNTYRGTTAVNGGTLQIGDGSTIGTLGSGPVTIASGAFLTINRSNSYGTVSNQSFSGDGTLVKEGAGGLVFNGSFNANNSVTNLQNLTVNNGLVRVDNNGKWKSDLNLTASGSGIFELWNTNTSLGTLNGNGTVRNAVFYFNGPTVLTVAAGSFSGTITDSGITSGGAGTGDTRLNLVKAGSGTLTLSGGNSYGGSTTINGGTLQIGDGSTTGTLGSGAVTIDSGAFLIINRSNFYGTVPNQSFSGAGTLVKEGTGDLVIDGTYNANNSVTNLQNLIVNNGLVFAGNNGTWKSDLNLTASGSGKFELWNTNTSLGVLNGNGIVQNTRNWLNGPTVLTVAAGSFSGTITDSGITSGGEGTGDTRLNLVKSGVGTLTLSGINSYGGATTVSDGTLSLGNGTTNSNLADSAAVTIATGATLNLNFTGSDTVGSVKLGDTIYTSPGNYNATTYPAFFTGTGNLLIPEADPYANWMSTNFPSIVFPDNLPGADPENDGIVNLMEYVLLGGDPSISNTGILPTLDASGASFVFTYYRRTAATGTTQTFQYGANLIGWTDVIVAAGGAVAILPDTPQAGTETVTITVPKGTESRLFGRLKVSAPPAQP